MLAPYKGMDGKNPFLAKEKGFAWFKKKLSSKIKYFVKTAWNTGKIRKKLGYSNIAPYAYFDKVRIL